jgi:hypothetical protein
MQPNFADRALGSFHLQHHAMTVEMCQALVRDAGYTYAAVQFYSECFGGNDISKYVTPGICDRPCAGNTTQNCGGACTNRIFRVIPGIIIQPWKWHVAIDCATLEQAFVNMFVLARSCQ